MIILFENYKVILPQMLWKEFLLMAERANGRPIIYKDRVLRFATIDEY